MKPSRTLRVLFILTAVGAWSLAARPDCEWRQQQINALKNHFPGENACRVLAGPRDEVVRSLADIDAELLRQKEPIDPGDREYGEDQEWLNFRLGRLSNAAGQPEDPQRVVVVKDRAPDAFASGGYVILTSGLLDWFNRPRRALEHLGLTPEQADAYLAPFDRDERDRRLGRDGLLAIVFMESAHNRLGHADASPLAQVCDAYIAEQRHQFYEYEQTLAMGKKPGWFSRTFSGPHYDSLSIDEHREEADADALGRDLLWQETGDEDDLERALRWLARLPQADSIPKSRMTSVSGMLCSDRASLQARADALRSTRHSPAQVDPRSPVQEVVARYHDMQKWISDRQGYLDRLQRGELSPDEKGRTVFVELEAKPKKATLLLDGTPQPTAKLKLPVSIGPHVIASSYKGLTRELHILVVEDGPTKFSVEAK